MSAPVPTLFTLAQDAMNLAEDYGALTVAEARNGRAPDERAEEVRLTYYRRRHQLLAACRRVDEGGRP